MSLRKMYKDPADHTNPTWKGRGTDAEKFLEAETDQSINAGKIVPQIMHTAKFKLVLQVAKNNVNYDKGTSVT